MKKKGILVAAALFGCLFGGTAAAEQPAAQTYRDMFQQGTFYLEYQRDDTSYILQQQGSERQMKMKAGKKGSWQTQAMFKDAAYYKQQPEGKKVSFLRLPAEKMGSTLLNRTEHWETVRQQLALPDELLAFDWDDSFTRHAASQAQPVYYGSSQRTVDGVTYDCDQYVSDVKTQAGTVSAQIVYNMLYQNGSLVKVQEILLYKGQEIPVDTLNVVQLTSTVPEGAFTFQQEVNVYAAGQGDIDELLGHKVQVETLGGKTK